MPVGRIEMGKQFYIASGFANKNLVSHSAASFKAKGFVHTYDWTKNEKTSSVEALHEIGTAELKAVMTADFVLIILPGGKGTHVELGIAIASGKKIYLYSKDPKVFLETTFYQVSGVEHFTGDIGNVIDRIVEIETDQLFTRKN
jgi:nucleoside 2-deoxyribosyltransferase